MIGTQAFYSFQELTNLGIKQLGKDVLISRKCSIYGAEHITMGDNIRVDDFCILSGRITLGSHIHVAAYTGLFGGGGIFLADFCNLSSRVSIYSVSDDFSGETLTNPTIPDQFKSVETAPVKLGRHTILGCGSVVLPGITIEDGCAIGALSLVNRNLEPWGIYAGVPVQLLKYRSRNLLSIEKKFLASYEKSVSR